MCPFDLHTAAWIQAGGYLAWDLLLDTILRGATLMGVSSYLTDITPQSTTITIITCGISSSLAPAGIGVALFGKSGCQHITVGAGESTHWPLSLRSLNHPLGNPFWFLSKVAGAYITHLLGLSPEPLS